MRCHRSSGATRGRPAGAQPLGGVILCRGFVEGLVRISRYALRPPPARDTKSLRRSGRIWVDHALPCGVEEVINFLCQRLAYAGDGFDVHKACRCDGTCRAEVLQQGAFAPSTNAGDFIERIDANSLRALLPVASDCEAMRLIAQPLEVVENGALGIEPERFPAGHIEMLASRV